MIPSSYSYVFVHRSQGCDGVLKVDLYRFTSIKSGLDYIVRVEEYPNAEGMFSDWQILVMVALAGIV